MTKNNKMLFIIIKNYIYNDEFFFLLFEQALQSEHPQLHFPILLFLIIFLTAINTIKRMAIIIIKSATFINYPLNQKKKAYNQCYNPCNCTLHKYYAHSPSSSHFPANGRNSCNTRSIKQ